MSYGVQNFEGDGWLWVNVSPNQSGETLRGHGNSAKRFRSVKPPDSDLRKTRWDALPRPAPSRIPHRLRRPRR
jgi:hypothetical protein